MKVKFLKIIANLQVDGKNYVCTRKTMHLRDGGGPTYTVYCVDHSFDTPGNYAYNIWGNLDEATTNCLIYGFPNKHFTGDDNKDYYITNVALQILNKNMTSKNSKGEDVRTNTMAEQVENGNCSDPDGIRGYIMDLVNKARTQVANYINLGSVTSITKDGDYYITNKISISHSDTLKSYDLHSDYEAINIDKTGFQLKIPASEIDGNSYKEIKGVNVVGHFDGGDSAVLGGIYGQQKVTVLKVGDRKSNDLSFSVSTPKLEIIKQGYDENGKLKRLKGVTISIYQNGNFVKSGVTDENGHIDFGNLPAGKYTAKETATPKGYVLDTQEQSFEVKASIGSSDNIVLNFKNSRYPNISINKKGYDENGNLVNLKGVEISIFNKNNNKIASGLTDDNGNINFGTLEDKVKVGETYTARETKTIKGYILDSTPQTFTINKTTSSKQDIHLSFVDKRYQEINIDKYGVDEYGKDVRLMGAEITIFDENNNAIAKGTTDENGHLSFGTLENKIKIGKTYTAKETKAPNGYVLDSQSQKFTLKAVTNKKDYIYLKFNDKLQLGSLELNKIDADTGDKISSAVFKVTDDRGRDWGTITTNAEGKGSIKNLPVYNVGERNTATKKKYTLTEISTNEDYYFDSTKIEGIELTNNSTTSRTITNKHKLADLRVIKYDKDNKDIRLGNVEFELYTKEPGHEGKVGWESRNEDNGVITYIADSDLKNAKSYTFHTSSDGEFVIKNLRANQYYYLKETKHNKWYKLINEAYVDNKLVEVKDGIVNDLYLKAYSDSTTEKYVEQNRIEMKLDIPNELIKGQVKVIKVDKDNNEVKLEGVKFNVLDKNGKVLETITTDKNGEATSSKYPIRDYRKLTLLEASTLKEYKLNDKKQTITFTKEEIKNIKFENELKKAKIQVIKSDVDTKVRLQNVEFDVIDNTTKEKVDHIKTNKKGEATTKDLRIDHTYTLKETKTNKFYKLNTDEIVVDLTKYIDNYKDNIVEKVDITNEKMKGQVEIIKTDGETTYPLKDVTFEVYDEKGKVVDTLVTDDEGKATSKKLPIDQKYTVKETITNKGYVLNDKPQTIELKEDEISTLKFENNKGKGKIKIIKTSSDGIVEGFKFNIKGTSYTGEEVDLTVTTDKDGLILTDDILEGKYTITEVRDDLSNGYIEPESQEVEVKNGETAEVYVYNEKIVVPKTGDNSHIKLAIGIIILSLLGLAWLFIKLFKGKK